MQGKGSEKANFYKIDRTSIMISFFTGDRALWCSSFCKAGPESQDSAQHSKCFYWVEHSAEQGP